ncbi:MAG: hypothetical protein J6A90_01265 [Clostridia bacterium]|nr:hypothetical protein [Clostridia bacterium]
MFKKRLTTDEQNEREYLQSLSEKELLIEILLQLNELNRQSRKIKRNQILWGN